MKKNKALTLDKLTDLIMDTMYDNNYTGRKIVLMTYCKGRGHAVTVGVDFVPCEHEGCYCCRSLRNSDDERNIGEFVEGDDKG